ncbi:TlpA disulfide reductase family protein [Pseudokineococcus marinus]|uniref:TlpA family protein disulfide reductase n=1 Tax=Pseudokineococcus marinus TaxID=351215 RepID=A0A849BIY3_9ACTN|nr:TlpA disulfide reductase family protein [Pseudokineococcus marinus]NNH23169.1 TlpA family protein disulfide reductase [Pseudokineococcus marinus]
MGAQASTGSRARAGRAARGALAAAALVGAAGLAGCTTSDAQPSVVDQGYVAGDGSLVQLAPDERGEPVELAGTTLQGEAVDVADWRGAPVVLNTWFAACGPCRLEAPDLAEVSAETADEGVRFLGLNTSDGAAQGIAFEEQFGITYPSLLDRDGEGVLALRGQLPPSATPTTLVLDPQGRVAARFLGPVDPSTLRTVIDDAAAEAA